ncbi:MAG: hypothetical protein JSW61_02845 [Candidatus Thorarchaeota archaeon]|nr:MAG: hypothetical protein JSW61_02845 [Candidatus Thorarchaeota archaeon]
MADQNIEDPTRKPVVIKPVLTTGIVMGCDVHDWAGFMSGTVILRRTDGERMALRYGKKSDGRIPKVGSRVTVTHSEGALLEIINIEILEENCMTISEMAEQFREGLTYIAGRPLNSVIMVLGLILGGLTIVMFGILKSWKYPLALSFYGLVGVVDIAIGILLWNRLGDC